ncbi:MAG TPA: 2-dehydropantoate 2-reductase N-terminal domain-containing protein [Pseudolysinimonas sp.]
MKILMFGRGVIAGIYGWALERAGHDVEFYVRPGRAREYGGSIELDLIDARRNPLSRPVRQAWPVRLRESLDDGREYDLVVVSVSHHRLAEAMAFLRPRIGATTVLVLGNLWAEPSDAIAGLPEEQVVWGFPGAGGGFRDDGTLFGALLPFVVLGPPDPQAPERQQAVAALFRGANIRVRQEPDIRGWLWIHFIADVGMHAQGARLGSLSKLIGDSSGLRQALLTTRELLALLQARGVDLDRHRPSTRLYRMPTRIAAVAMSAVMSIPLARRSLEAHTDGRAAEPTAVIRDTLDEARRWGIRVPRTEAAAQLLG